MCDLQDDLGHLFTDLFTFLFPYFWLVLLCCYYRLVTDEPVCPIDFLSLLYALFSGCPSAWLCLLNFALATWSGFQLTGGCWWIFFKWLRTCPYILGLFVYYLSLCGTPQLYHQDVRFHFYTLDVTLFSPKTLHQTPKYTRHFNPVLLEYR